jgi:hypothetical protein
MYEYLCNYVKEERAKNNGTWDGNVPPNWRIEDKPPVNLGRWINRQRCAYAKRLLKREFVMKLEQTGLKLSVQDQKKPEFDEDDDFEGEEFISRTIDAKRSTPEIVLSNSSTNNTAAARSAALHYTPKTTPLPQAAAARIIQNPAAKIASSATDTARLLVKTVTTASPTMKVASPAVANSTMNKTNSAENPVTTIPTVNVARPAFANDPSTKTASSTVKVVTEIPTVNVSTKTASSAVITASPTMKVASPAVANPTMEKTNSVVNPVTTIPTVNVTRPAFANPSTKTASSTVKVVTEIPTINVSTETASSAVAKAGPTMKVASSAIANPAMEKTNSVVKTFTNV